MVFHNGSEVHDSRQADPAEAVPIDTQPAQPRESAELTDLADSSAASVDASAEAIEAPPAQAPTSRATPALRERLAGLQQALLDLSPDQSLLDFGPDLPRLDLADPDAVAALLGERQPLHLQSLHKARNDSQRKRGERRHDETQPRLDVDLPADEFDARVLELLRLSRAARQAGNGDRLVVALGMLGRHGAAAEAIPHAPLLLVPATLTRDGVRPEFTLTLHGDEACLNPLLVERLRQQFDIDLDGLARHLPRRHGGVDVAAVWQAVGEAVGSAGGWQLTPAAMLTTLPLAAGLIGRDLAARGAQLLEHPLVGRLLGLADEDTTGQAAVLPSPRQLDRSYSPEQIVFPLSADASQLAALMAAAEGRHLLLIGPPGTGKSQTIVNLIAQALGSRKRVLFVAQKPAALAVVQRRLREIGLGEFCLALYGDGADGGAVIDQLRDAWAARGAVDADAWRSQAQRLKRLRDELNGYSQRLHLRHPNGLTIQQAIGQVVGGAAMPDLKLRWSHADLHRATDMQTMRDTVGRLDAHAAALGRDHLLDNPLVVIGRSDWSAIWQQKLVDSALSVIDAARAVQASHDQFVAATGLPALPLTRRGRDAVGALARTLPHAAGRDWRFAVRADSREICERLQAGMALVGQHQRISAQLATAWPAATVAACRHGLTLLAQRRSAHAALGQPWGAELVDELGKGLALLEQIAQARQQLSVVYSDQIETLDVRHLQREWAKAEVAIWPASWVAKRKLLADFDRAITGDVEPDLARDLPLLVRIRALRNRASTLDLGAATDGVWAGLRTRRELANCALHFQQVLRAAREGEPWDDAGLDAVADRSCGERLANELTKLRALKSLDAEIAGLDHLGPATGGLWAGRSTRIADLEAALRFDVARELVRAGGVPADEHPAVANGDCGEAMAADFKRLRDRAAIEHQLDGFADLAAPTADLWRGLKTRPDEIDKACKFQASMASAMSSLAATADDLVALSVPLERLLGSGNALLAQPGPVVVAGQHFLKACGALQPAIDALALSAEFSAAAKSYFCDVGLLELVGHCTALVDSIDHLNAWCGWRKTCRQAANVGLASLVTAIENGVMASGESLAAFEVAYCRWWLDAVVVHEPLIDNFVAEEQQQRIVDFAAVDQQFRDLTAAAIRAMLCAAAPSPDSAELPAQWAMLRELMTDRQRPPPPRELFDAMPAVLARLAPCMLADPATLASHLGTTTDEFDLVIFDEASQLATGHALAAIARARQLVIVGDPRQLAPAAAAGSATGHASLLDAGLAAGLPTIELDRHYRSHSERLIEFANRHYYRGALLAVAAPTIDDASLSLHPVDAPARRGSSRGNEAEARALVADLVAQIVAQSADAPPCSVGVVCFSVRQRTLIENLLDEERRRDPRLERWFAVMQTEPPFVSLVDDVQGDERDIILLSLGCTPDPATLDASPLGQDGGERRLNVAITRARRQLRVFSSLRAGQIDMTRLATPGWRDLKQFLEFAEAGAALPAAAVDTTDAGPASPAVSGPFEQAVAAALRGVGWRVDARIGGSPLCIDLAVVDPDDEQRYLAAIECDGAVAHLYPTARDRDLLREQLLRQRGWQFVRTWSTQWWIDPGNALRLLDRALRALLAERRAGHAAPVQAAAPAAADESVDEDGDAVGAMQRAAAPPPSSPPGSDLRADNP